MPTPSTDQGEPSSAQRRSSRKPKPPIRLSDYQKWACNPPAASAARRLTQQDAGDAPDARAAADEALAAWPNGPNSTADQPAGGLPGRQLQVRTDQRGILGASTGVGWLPPWLHFLGAFCGC